MIYPSLEHPNTIDISNPAWIQECQKSEALKDGFFPMDIVSQQKRKYKNRIGGSHIHSAVCVLIVLAYVIILIMAL